MLARVIEPWLRVNPAAVERVRETGFGLKEGVFATVRVAVKIFQLELPIVQRTVAPVVQLAEVCVLVTVAWLTV